MLNFLVNNITLSIKLLAFIGQVLSGVFAFLLIEEITEDSQAGFIGGLAFALAPWHVFQVLDFGRHTTIFIYALLPVPFLFFEKYRHRKLSLYRAGILSGLSFSLLIGFQYQYAMFIVMLFVFYVMLNSISRQKPYIDLHYIKLIGVAGLVCMGTAIGFIVPFLLESGYLQETLAHFSQKKMSMDQATFGALFTRQGGPDFHKGYIGLSFFVLSLVGVFSALRHKKYPLLVMYAFSAFINLGHGTAIYEYIPFIYTQSSTERMIIYLILFMAVMAGEGVKILKKGLTPRFGKWVWQAVFIILVVICFSDVAVTKDRKWSGTHLMAGIFQKFNLDMSRYDLPHARTIRSILICSQPSLKWLFGYVLPATLTIETPTSITRGYLFHGVKGLPYLEDGRKWVKRDIESGKKDPSSQNYLYLMNIGYIFYMDRNSRTKIINIPRATPAIASGRLGWQEKFSSYPMKDDSGIMEPLIEQMGLDRERNSAGQILLINDLRLPDRPFNGSSRLDVLNFEQTTNKSFLEVQASHDCYLRLSHTYYPFLNVYVDNNRVPFYETSQSMIALPLPMGRHRVRIEPYISPLRKVCYSLNFIFLVLAVVFYRHFKFRPEKGRVETQKIDLAESTD